jgi:uncharacterized protein (DUF1697 family)
MFSTLEYEMEIAIFLRGINVSGHHKVPMKELKECLSRWGFKQIRTILNTGNILIECDHQDLVNLTCQLESDLKKQFGFEIPVFVMPTDELRELVKDNPFKLQPQGERMRYYLTLLKESPKDWLNPWQSDEGMFQVISIQERKILSVLDLGVVQTTKGMDLLESRYGKNLTTRNWNTIVKMAAL